MAQYPEFFDHAPARRAARAMLAHRAATLASASYLTAPFRVEVHSGIAYGEDRRPRLTRFANNPPKRGEVRSLSAASRRRLTRFFCEINTEDLSAPIFVTLTFRNDRAKEESYRCLRVWLKSIRRHYRGMQWLWRMELQQRGVVHFHLFLWHRPGSDEWIRSPALRKWLCKEWHRIADPSNRAHSRYGCLVEPIQDRRKARQYVAKYCAKDCELDILLTGRRWGHSASIPRQPVSTCDLTERQAIVYRRIARRLMDRTHPHGAEKPRPTHRRRLRAYATDARKIATYCDIATTARILRDVVGIPSERLGGLSKYLPPQRVTNARTMFAPREVVTSAGTVFQLPLEGHTSALQRAEYRPCNPLSRSWKPSPSPPPRPPIYDGGHGFQRRTLPREIRPAGIAALL